VETVIAERVNGAAVAEPVAAVEPLRVSGLVVRRADLVAALRLYVPALVDIESTQDGDHFWLMLGPGGPSDRKGKGHDPAAPRES
jgi:hypothetical protein